MPIPMRLGAVLAAALLFPACATVTRGTQQKFDIVSEPVGAEAKLSNGIVCTTPCHLKLRRKDDFTVVVSKPGYTPEQVVVESKMHGGGGTALAGNILAGGIIGGVLDGTSGALNDLRPNPVHVSLKEIAAVAPAAEAASPAEAAPSAAESVAEAVPSVPAAAPEAGAPAPAEASPAPASSAAPAPAAPSAAAPAEAPAPAVSSDSRR